MKVRVEIGETRTFEKLVTEEDLARFNGEVVHGVCSTFALAQALEWASRLFVFDLAGPGEEGLGTYLKINHKQPAFPGEIITITATLQQIKQNEIICFVVAKVGNRLISDGETGQKIYTRENLAKILNPKRS